LSVSKLRCHFFITMTTSMERASFHRSNIENICDYKNNTGNMTNVQF